eukprot:390082-Pyramimonas_sp.AAC.1
MTTARKRRCAVEVKQRQAKARNKGAQGAGQWALQTCGSRGGVLEPRGAWLDASANPDHAWAGCGLLWVAGPTGLHQRGPGTA